MPRNAEIEYNIKLTMTVLDVNEDTTEESLKNTTEEMREELETTLNEITNDEDYSMVKSKAEVTSIEVRIHEQDS